MLKQTTPIKTDIRKGTPADAKILTRLAASTFYDAFAESNTAENMEFYMSHAFTVPQMTAELSDPRSSFLIAAVDAQPVGYAKLFAGEVPDCIVGDDPIELARLYVEQDWLGSGVGAALMQSCLNEARRMGYKTIFLGVWEHNYRAQAFYRKWLFGVVGSHIFQMGDDPQTDLLMERPL